MRSRLGWPPGLECETKNGKTYYRYRDPVTKQSTGLGTDLKAAKSAAKMADAQRNIGKDAVQQLFERISAPRAAGRSLAQHADKFRQLLRERRFKRTGLGLSEKTLKQYDLQLSTFLGRLGNDTAVADVGRAEIAEFLDSFPARASNAYRSLLTQYFEYALAQGLIETNPVTKTMARDHVVERRRLTLEWYEAIYKAADPWFKAAMNLGRRSLQRRQDLVRLRWDHYAGGILEVQQEKLRTRGLGKLRIHAHEELDAAIRQCRDDVASPFMIHRRTRIATSQRYTTEWRQHWTQLHADMLTDEFARIRDELGICAEMPARQRPSFHEIRGFASDELERSGADKKLVSLLLGHADEKTTELYYLSRHGGEKWADVKLK